jgi:hypothetical protein
VRHLLQDRGEPGDALVDASAAVFDDPVGVQQHRGAGLQGNLVVGARAGVVGAEQPLRRAVQRLHAASPTANRLREPFAGCCAASWLTRGDQNQDDAGIVILGRRSDREQPVPSHRRCAR